MPQIPDPRHPGQAIESDLLILQMLDTLADKMADGFGHVNQRLDTLNGRTRTAEASIAVLQDRTKDMVCATHSEQFRQLTSAVERIDERGPRARPVRDVALTGGAGGALVILADLVMKWLGR